VENVLSRTSDLTTEIVIWDNASTDDTAAYLDSLTDPRLKIVHSPTNIGMNAYDSAVQLTHGTYLIELDDDVIDAPHEWDRTLLEAFNRLPEVGYLAASMVDDPNSWCAEIFHHQSEYVRREVNDVAILEGPVGGYCTMTTRELYDKVGGFGEERGHVFWGEEQPFIEKLDRLGHQAAVLADLEVHHASGPYYSDVVREKVAYYTWRDRRTRRRNRVKRALVKVPGIARLNEQHGWFHVLEEDYQPPAEIVGEKRSFVADRRLK
jgi:GT2 family glycosyltransferase